MLRFYVFTKENKWSWNRILPNIFTWIIRIFIYDFPTGLNLEKKISG